MGRWGFGGCFSNLREAVDDPGAWDRVRIGDVRPGRDRVDPSRVLHRYGVAYVCKLAILKNHKLVLVREGHELLPKLWGKVRHDIHVRLQNANVGPDLVRELENLAVSDVVFQEKGVFETQTV
jgi:hypothetical protein